MNRQQWLARAEEHEAKLAELMERDEDGSYAAYFQESARIARHNAAEAAESFGALYAECMDTEFWNFRAPELLK